MQMKAHRVHIPRANIAVTIEEETPEEVQERVRQGWSHKVTLVIDPLTPEELAIPFVELPRLAWSKTTFLALEMLTDFRDWEAYKKADKHDWTSGDTIEHVAFVKTHHALPYTFEMYLAHRCEKGLKCYLDELTDRYFHALYFEHARDFIRECALNNYYATYG